LCFSRALSPEESDDFFAWLAFGNFSCSLSLLLFFWLPILFPVHSAPACDEEGDSSSFNDDVKKYLFSEKILKLNPATLTLQGVK
jgi:hypothetical protein